MNEQMTGREARKQEQREARKQEYCEAVRTHSQEVKAALVQSHQRLLKHFEKGCTRFELEATLHQYQWILAQIEESHYCQERIVNHSDFVADDQSTELAHSESQTNA